MLYNVCQLSAEFFMMRQLIFLLSAFFLCPECIVKEIILSLCIGSTTLQSLINAKLSQQRFWPCHEFGLFIFLAIPTLQPQYHVPFSVIRAGLEIGSSFANGPNEFAGNGVFTPPQI